MYDLPPNHKWTLSLNVQAVVVLASKDDRLGRPPSSLRTGNMHGVLAPENDVDKPVVSDNIRDEDVPPEEPVML